MAEKLCELRKKGGGGKLVFPLIKQYQGNYPSDPLTTFEIDCTNFTKLSVDSIVPYATSLGYFRLYDKEREAIIQDMPASNSQQTVDISNVKTLEMTMYITGGQARGYVTANNVVIS